MQTFNQVIAINDIGNEKFKVIFDNNVVVQTSIAVIRSMRIVVGSSFNIKQLKETIRVFFKKAWGGKKQWEMEKKRIERAKTALHTELPYLAIEEVGFGADTTEFLDYHPSKEDQSGADCLISANGFDVCYMEVTGSYIRQPQDMLIRKDKIEKAMRESLPTLFALVYKDNVVFYAFNPLQNVKFETRTLKGVVDQWLVVDKNDPAVMNKNQAAWIIYNQAVITGAVHG